MIVSAVMAETLSGGDDMDWFTVDGGGGEVTGGNFVLAGTAGQPDAGGPMTGGSFSFTGGFWGGIKPSYICPADLNGSGVVDIDDLVIVITNWGNLGGRGDANVNGVVDIDDLVLVITAWGMCPQS